MIFSRAHKRALTHINTHFFHHAHESISKFTRFMATKQALLNVLHCLITSNTIISAHKSISKLTRFMATEQALLNVKTDEEFDMTYGVEVRVLTNRF